MQDIVSYLEMYSLQCKENDYFIVEAKYYRHFHFSHLTTNGIIRVIQETLNSVLHIERGTQMIKIHGFS